MPTPNRGESQSAFVSRYVSSPEAVKSFPDQKQRLAVAYSLHKQHSQARHIRQRSSANSTGSASIGGSGAGNGGSSAGS